MITCAFENGNKASLRHAVVDVIIVNVKKNQILLVKRAAHLSNPNKYALPGGFVNRDETIAEAAKRETLEETGYDIDILKLVEIIDNPHRKGEDRQNISFLYLAQAGEKIAQSDNEVSECKWFDLNNLPNEEKFAFDHFDHLRRAKEKGLLT